MEAVQVYSISISWLATAHYIKGLELTAKKIISFKEEITTRTVQTYKSENVSKNANEENHLESAVESDEDEDWKDKDQFSSPSRSNEKGIIQRVNAKPNLFSQHSLLTKMMHEEGRAAAGKNTASRFCSVRIQEFVQPSHSRLIAIATFHTHPSVQSPHTIRRDMFSAEFSESLQKNLLRERQAKHPMTKVGLPSEQLQGAKSYDSYFHAVFLDYFDNILYDRL